jgi:hypothetical protein
MGARAQGTEDWLSSRNLRRGATRNLRRDEAGETLEAHLCSGGRQRMGGLVHAAGCLQPTTRHWKRGAASGVSR